MENAPPPACGEGHDFFRFRAAFFQSPLLTFRSGNRFGSRQLKTCKSYREDLSPMITLPDHRSRRANRRGAEIAESATSHFLSATSVAQRFADSLFHCGFSLRWHAVQPKDGRWARKFRQQAVVYWGESRLRPKLSAVGRVFLCRRFREFQIRMFDMTGPRHIPAGIRYSGACLLLLALSSLLSLPSAVAEEITFNKHIAPVMWKNCSGCHRPGEVGPFSLIRYQDAAKRSNFLAEITADRSMPPWKPDAELWKLS